MKKIEVEIKIQIKSGQANPSPPIGPVLGARGINIMKFCNEFNEKTNKLKEIKKGTPIPTIIKIYKDKSFDFIIKSPPTSFLIKDILNIEKGSQTPNKLKISKIKKDQIQFIVNQKINDLIVNTNKAAINTISGTAKSIGIDIDG